jgi:hypothetical protein
MATSMPPPNTGAFAYNTFIPGSSYIDPVFSATVRRLTGDHGHDDIYARNMCWSADETRYLHRTGGLTTDAWNIVTVATGAVTHTAIPFGTIAADGGFDPVEPNRLHVLDGSVIKRVLLGSAGAFTTDTYFTAPSTLLTLGGSINWISANGRYMLVRYGSEPSVHLWDRTALGSGAYANPIDATNTVNAGGYLGLSPDGAYVVGFDSRVGVGFAGVGQGVAWPINHGTRTIAAAPTIFWSLCGDHGAFMTASDGRTYFITYNCSSASGLWRVDVTNNAVGLNEAAQIALPHNQLLIPFDTAHEFGHVSTVATGTRKDWAFISTEDSTDAFNGPVSPWHAYRQELVAVNVLTGQIQRLAHHRSRGLPSDYYSQPRVSCSWAGLYVGFASNFNQP